MKSVDKGERGVPGPHAGVSQANDVRLNSKQLATGCATVNMLFLHWQANTIHPVNRQHFLNGRIL